ncbi:MAG: HD domain-containing phosphohydrolase [Alphaproteobacteria bacterium]|jgi:HD-GYP domain-containing protein (c-di-GMP phosphodiesterase class II)|nr:transcriptional regulator [Rhodospirillaceae bacterium]MDP6021752.1 HD domain-containing phosphohydrolase [Alphaproteobacteria bacterium]MDP7055189.1 HD domain-containing phosphohydrolase [Alphaproteobacteria bacterium]MDP7229991.1 HD domain-containing phosphohydrolase [Alphaproteobacteria bacterium]MDP7460701.1 HD domain-containing phosphohydrolase [Alphaproteobacteria bacterium]|tara:strand:- start:3161 stop:4396 length:1236 start_codon:yes stop_codon:yes gene_type:complete
MTASNQALEFLEFVERQPRQTVRQLMNKVLLKSRLMTGAEAGTIFIVRRKGQQRWLEPISLQNDIVRIGNQDFIVPITTKSIAGFVASSGEFVRIRNVYKIPAKRPYSFNPDNELSNYHTSSMLCFPLKNYQEQVIGVVQLINRRTPGADKPVPFEDEQVQLVTPIARVLATHIERADMLENIRQKNSRLRQRNRELGVQRAQVLALQADTEEAFLLSIQLLARASEIHDEGTGNHIVRVNEYSYFLAKEYGMPKAFCDEIRYSAQLHDVGKMSVDVAVLKKMGSLDADERAEMDKHSFYGHQILEATPRLQMAAEIALYHHEQWDGGGYPMAAVGENIPLSARIVSVADIYDALRSERPYKPAFSHKKTIDIMLRGDHRIDPACHFDPKLIALLAKRHQGMNAIYRRLKD